MLILASMGPKVHIEFRLIFGPESVPFLGCDMGGGVPRQKMTKCDMGGEVVKNIDFLSDILF